MVKHTYTIRRVLPTNCLSVFDHVMGLALKGLRDILSNMSMSNMSNKYLQFAFFIVIKNSFSVKQVFEVVILF